MPVPSLHFGQCLPVEGITITLIISQVQLPFGLDANIFGVTASAITFQLFILYTKSFTKPQLS
jgi:hypothetical protein